MNISFLIGNGFDLGLGLHTKYSDYYNKFFEDAKDKPAKDLAGAIKGNIIDWSDFEKKIGEYTDNFTRQTKEDFFSAIDSFEEGLLTYLKSEQEKVTYNPEIVVPTLKKALFDFYNTNILTPDDSQKIQNTFQHFKPKSCKINFINFNYTNTLERCLEIFPPRIVESDNGEPSSWEWKIGNVVHVHGTVEGYSILGVDNATQINKSELANDSDFVRRFVKPRINQRIGMQFSSEANDFINNSQIICIYGMSIGATDATWWKTIAQWLHKDRNHRIILFIHDEKFNSMLSRRIVKETDSAIQNFLQYSGLNQTVVSELSERIYVAINKDIFAMKLI